MVDILRNMPILWTKESDKSNKTPKYTFFEICLSVCYLLSILDICKHTEGWYFYAGLKLADNSVFKCFSVCVTVCSFIPD